MTRRAWLLLAWGILLLTVVDGVMLSFDPRYEQPHANNKNNNDNKRPYGPVIPIVLGTLSLAEELIETHEKLLVVLSTAAIAAFTYTLWRATSGLQTLAAKQAVDVKTSLGIAKESADAATKSALAAVNAAAPYLEARIVKFDLYPEAGFTDETTHNPNIVIAFENIGNTPAILRRKGVKLVIFENDVIPPEPPAIADIASVEDVSTIPAHKMGAGRMWYYGQMIGAEEIRRLVKFAKRDFSRFYAVGYIIYEDVFSVRHTKRFCMKVMPKFVASRGGPAYNSIKREDAAKNELGGLPSETV